MINPKTEIPYEIRCEIIGFIKAGKNFTECAKFYNLEISTVSRIYWKYQETGYVSDKMRTGRPKKLNQDLSEMAVKELEDTQENTRKIGSLYDASHQTIMRLANESNVMFKYPKTIPKLTSLHVKIRFDFCEKFKNTDFSSWLYCDESSFELNQNTMGIWTSEKNPVIPMQKSKQKLTVWACIGKKGKSEMHILKPGEIIDQFKYLDILNETLLPLVNLLFPDGNYYFYQDNAPPHIAKSVKDWMEMFAPNAINAPPNSPDLNPIEMIWAILKNGIEKLKPDNIDELKKYILGEWEKLSQDTIDNCIFHVEERIKEVHENQGEFC